MLIINRRSGTVNVGYFHNFTAWWGGSISKKSARMPRVRPQRSSGRVVSLESACPLRHHPLKRWTREGLGVFSSGTNPGVVVHWLLSDGRSLTAENCIQPIRDRTTRRVRNPPCRAKRCDISTYSTVRSDGDRRARRGIQCVDATSVGCNRRVGESLRVVRKTKGQRTINLSFKSVIQFSTGKVNWAFVRFRPPAGSDYPLREIAHTNGILRCQI